MQSLDRAFKILRTLRLRGQAKLGEIAAELPAESNTAWNILSALGKLGYVRKNKRNSYSLGGECMRFFGGGFPDFKTLLQPCMEELCKDIKESAVAVNLAGAELHIIQKADYGGRVIISDGIHCRKNALYYWASGRVVMAWQPDCVIKNIIEKRGFPSGKEWRGVTSETELLLKLRDIRSRGFEERHSGGMCSLAVPVFDAQGNYHLALGVVYKARHETKVHRETILRHLLLTSKKLSLVF